MANQGNTFDQTSYRWGHSRKVWREVEKVKVGGFTVSNVADWVNLKVIPAGTALNINETAHTATAYTDAQIKAENFTGVVNAFSQEDAYITDANTVATVAAVYRGRIYEFSFDAAALPVIKTKLAGDAANGIVFETGV